MIKLPAYLGGFSSRKDKSASVRFTTQELTPEDISKLQEHSGDFGWLIFAPEETESVAVPKEAPTDNKKTPSQRVRAVLYVWWQQLGSKGDFEVFYTEKMELLIEWLKKKLDD